MTDLQACAVLEAEHALAHLQALLLNIVPLSGLATRYVGDLVQIVECGLDARRVEIGLQPRAAA